MTKKESKTKKPEMPKASSLFDHVNHIRKIQSADYMDKLSDADMKSFSHYMILRFLSMDRKSIDVISSISKYFDIIPSKNFYSLCITVTPRNNQFYPYIKSKSTKLNKKLLELVSKKFEVSKTEASEYCKLFMNTENGVDELINICKSYGLTDKEVEELISYE